MRRICLIGRGRAAARHPVKRASIFRTLQQPGVASDVPDALASVSVALQSAAARMDTFASAA
ncbi:hypothetical protein WS58_04755 [Burkholderia pseudomultivorans]|nr:hypothetical protein WS58_04755 [Burkholderia pseudomultivorans]